jgi:hypothetical protein
VQLYSLPLRDMLAKGPPLRIGSKASSSYLLLGFVSLAVAGIGLTHISQPILWVTLSAAITSGWRSTWSP